MSRSRVSWRIVWVAAATIALIGAIRPILFLIGVWDQDRHQVEPPPAGLVLADASHLDPTPIYALIEVPPGRGEAAAVIRDALDKARATKRHVSIAGARHSMGGQIRTEDGIVLDMRTHDRITVDADARTAVVESGATWADLLAAVDPLGLSVAIMQSNNSFSIGGAVSVNCHGWQPGTPPLVDSVRRLWVVGADGEVVQASRTHDPELFSHVVGGYGLFGVILEVELALVPNASYRMVSTRTDLNALPGAFAEATAAETPPGLMFARLDVRPDHLFDEVLINRLQPIAADSLPPIEPPALKELRRTVFLSTIGSDYGKKIRWNIERAAVELMQVRSFTRNQLLNEPVDAIADRDPSRTQILHEYFVPPDRSGAFLDAVERIVVERGADLLNVTVRDVRRDDVAALAYARTDVLAFVMLFNQATDAAGEAAQADLTRALVDAALDHGGTYYLPYRLHPTADQLHRAYPTAKAFFAEKRDRDPSGLFSNKLYETYGR